MSLRGAFASSDDGKRSGDRTTSALDEHHTRHDDRDAHSHDHGPGVAEDHLCAHGGE